MSRKTHSDLCEHKNQVIDEHEGIYICEDCAKVLDNIYIEPFDSNFKTEITFDNQNVLNSNKISSEFIHRLNIPDLNVEDKKNELKCASNIYLEANKSNCTVTLKEISAISGYSCKQISKETKNTVTLLNQPTLIEKFCKLLNLDYKTYTVIKENISKKEQSGHNPLTIVASHIYLHLKKEKKKKISMKKICDVVGISSISIQRYLKSIQ